MQISPQRLSEFKEIYKELYDVELSDQETYENALSLLGYARMCMVPVGTKIED
jgi:hypothetical protein